MGLGMCKVVVKNGVAELDKNTVKTLLSMSGAYAMSKVLPDDWKEQCRKNNVNPDGLLELMRELVGTAAGMCYGLIYDTEDATKELAKEMDCSVRTGTEEEYEKWEKEPQEFDGGVC